MNKLFYYTDNDVDIIDKNIDNIVRKGTKEQITKLDPTLNEYIEIKKFILNYIKDHHLILYGGYALHLSLKSINSSDIIYNDNEIYNDDNMYDIECYSHNSHLHIKNLSDLLFKHNYINIKASEALHPETFTIFVHCRKFLDITYMPSNVFHNIPIINYDKYKIIHPHFALIDKMRVLNNPLTAYFRLEKDLVRLKIILKNFPITFYNCDLKFKIDSETSKILEFIRKEILPKDSLITFNYYAYYYYIAISNNLLQESVNLNINHYDVISIDYKKDYTMIYEILSKNFNNIIIKGYHPFFQFLDKHVSFYFNDILILNLYSNYNSCIPYIYLPKKKIYITSFSTTIMYLMMYKYKYKIVDEDNDEVKNLDCMIVTLINERNKYLKNNNLSILDDSPFKEFVITCKGFTRTAKYDSCMLIKRRVENKLPAKIEYFPEKLKSNFDPDRKFNNSSGNINNNFKF